MKNEKFSINLNGKNVYFSHFRPKEKIT